MDTTFNLLYLSVLNKNGCTEKDAQLLWAVLGFEEVSRHLLKIFQNKARKRSKANFLYNNNSAAKIVSPAAIYLCVAGFQPIYGILYS